MYVYFPGYDDYMMHINPTTLHCCMNGTAQLNPGPRWFSGFWFLVSGYIKKQETSNQCKTLGRKAVNNKN